MTNLEIVKELVKLGYSLFGETEQHFANRFDNEALKMFLETFKNHHHIDK